MSVSVDRFGNRLYDYNTSIERGEIESCDFVEKFGFNKDVDATSINSAEVVASYGGKFEVVVE